MAFSRTKRRLLVLVSRTLLDFVPPRLEHYESTLSWKHLRAMYTHMLMRGELSAIPYTVNVEPT